MKDQKKNDKKVNIQLLPKHWKLGLTAILLIFLALSFAQKINLTTADLGRHIKNGETFFKQLRPISTNYYSYTEGENHVINYCWGTGAIFYSIWKVSGFTGLSLFYILIYLLTFLLFFQVAKKSSNFYFAFFFAVLSIPLIVSRTEIRPEGFSYLFLGIYFFLLFQFRKGKLSFKTLLIIPFLQILWVNLHVFFFMGIFIIATFFLESLILKRNVKVLKQYIILLTITIIACFVNPFGIEGALMPLSIFQESRYMLVEHQSVIFMQKRTLNPIYFHFEFLFLTIVISFLIIFLRKRIRHYIIQLLLMIFFSTLAWRVIRAFPLFGFFFIPVAAGNFYNICKQFSYSIQQTLYNASFMFSALIITFSLLIPYHYYSPFKGRGGLGLMKNVQASAEFFKQNNIKGPIFNNYDIGNYLIYHLFPDHKVFVDNRPEAYSLSFFQDTYIPIQEDEQIWEEKASEYDFNVIYFYRHDMTPWAQPFLIRRIKDPSWIPVSVDDYTLILLKDNEQNKELIEEFRLPEEMFSFSQL